MTDHTDLLVIGGGINGAGIARDAAGRGLSVRLVEADDLASHTSSASTKLIHGGLRYLEYREFRLVREALAERERLLRIAPHIAWPLRFVLPQPPDGRPGWLIRLGLFLYDHLGGRSRLPGSQAVRLAGTPLGAGLKPAIARGFSYWDGWVDDARLVVLNARDAADRGADILTRTRFLGAARDADRWTATLEAGGQRRRVTARALVNAAGAGVAAVLGAIQGAHAERPPRLVKGSHIVVPCRLPGEHALILQNADRRIVFAIPYENDFTLIGTTDVEVAAADAPAITPDETRYLCDSVNAYLADPVRPADVVWSYSGVRPLYDDGHGDAASITRDYVLRLGFDGDTGPQLISIFGGKITTFRKLSEHVLERLRPFLPPFGPAWTDTAPLPGGNFANIEDLAASLPCPAPLARRLAHAYGTDAVGIAADLGPGLGGGLHEGELRHLVTREWAREADDILWRRTKIGLHTGPETRAAVERRLAGRAA